MGQFSRTEDDTFAATRMSFGEHLEVLRWHLIRALVGFVLILLLVFLCDLVGCAFGSRFGIARPVKDFIVLPVEQELQSFFDRRVQKVLAGLEREPELQQLNQPTAFVRQGFSRQQLLTALQGRSADEVNRFPRPGQKSVEAKEGSSVESDPEEELYLLWVRHEEPLRETALLQQAQRAVGRRPTLATMNAMEGMMVYFKVAMLCGVVLGSPWILWEIWSFVAAGLYPHEKRPIYFYLPFSLLLFLGGILVCQFLVMPQTIAALLWFNEWLDLEPDFRLNEWLGFALLMPLVFGISFQTPLVILLGERLGILSIPGLRRHRRLAWFFLAVFAAVITPSIDLTMLFLWLPMGLLYELGILLSQARSGDDRSSHEGEEPSEPVASAANWDVT